MDVGELVGAQPAEARRRDPEWYRQWRDGGDLGLSGRRDVSSTFTDARCGRFIASWTAADGRTAVVVCHGGNIRAIDSDVVGLGRRRALAHLRRRQLQPHRRSSAATAAWPW